MGTPPSPMPLMALYHIPLPLRPVANPAPREGLWRPPRKPEEPWPPQLLPSPPKQMLEPQGDWGLGPPRHQLYPGHLGSNSAPLWQTWQERHARQGSFCSDACGEDGGRQAECCAEETLLAVGPQGGGGDSRDVGCTGNRSLRVAGVGPTTGMVRGWPTDRPTKTEAELAADKAGKTLMGWRR